MFHYEKKLQYPVKITKPNPQMARIIITQYGGPYCKEGNTEKSSDCKGFREVTLQQHYIKETATGRTPRCRF